MLVHYKVTPNISSHLILRTQTGKMSYKQRLLTLRLLPSTQRSCLFSIIVFPDVQTQILIDMLLLAHMANLTLTTLPSY